MQMATFDIPHVFMALSCIIFDIINPKANVCHRPGLPGGVAGQQPPELHPPFLRKLARLRGRMFLRNALSDLEITYIML